MNNFEEIYLDHAATTPVRAEVLDAMAPYWNESYGNPSSLHRFGQAARVAIDKARATVAHIFGCDFNEIIFTGSGTESDNLAILGTMRAAKIGQQAARTNADFTQTVADKIQNQPNPQFLLKREEKHIITTAIEHDAVLKSCQQLEREGFGVNYLKPNTAGVVTAAQIKEAVREETTLVSVMYANNEIGTLEPIAEIARVLESDRGQKPYFHTDACQAAGFEELDVKVLGVDLMTINASKIYGPKGVGALYIRRGVAIEPIIFGGGQEQKLRSGTENVPLIVGLAKALELAQAERVTERARLAGLRDWFMAELQKIIPDCRVNGAGGEQRLANNIHISLPGVDSETLLFLLDEAGIYASTGSACAAGTIEPSHVLMACGVSPQLAKQSLRFSLGKTTNRSDLERVITVLPTLVAKKLALGSARRRTLGQTNWADRT